GRQSFASTPDCAASQQPYPGSRSLRRRSPGPGTLSYCFSVGYATSASGSAPGHPQNRFPTGGLPTTYTETDTLRQHFVQNSWKFVLFTLHARHLKVRGGLGFSENGSRHHLNNGAGPPAPPRTRSQERGGRCRRPYRSLPPLSKGPPCPIFAKEPRPPYAPQA